MIEKSLIKSKAKKAIIKYIRLKLTDQFLGGFVKLIEAPSNAPSVKDNE